MIVGMEPPKSCAEWLTCSDLQRKKTDCGMPGDQAAKRTTRSMTALGGDVSVAATLNRGWMKVKTFDRRESPVRTSLVCRGTYY